MALCTIKYNSSTGVAAASGTGSPATAHTDVTLSATVSGTTATTTMTFSATINLSGVANDGTDVIRVTGTAGQRHLFRITAFTGGVTTCTGLTVAETIGATTITASAWAIGGTRGSAAAGTEQDTTLTDIEDGVAGWLYEYGGNAGTDGDYPMAVTRQVLAPGSLTDGPLVIAAAAGKTPQITTSYNDVLYTLVMNNYIRIENMAFKCTNTGTSNRLLGLVLARVTMIGCTVETGNVVMNTFAGMFLAVNCEFDGTLATGTGALITIGSQASGALISCKIHDSGGHGVSINAFRSGYSIIGCAFWACGTDSITISGDTKSTNRTIANNTIHNSGSDGIAITGVRPTTWDASGIQIYNNVITGSTGYGINSVNGGADLNDHIDFNAFGLGVGYVNTSGDMTSNITDQGNNQTLGTGDPYTNSAGNDYTIPTGDTNEDNGLGYNG